MRGAFDPAHVALAADAIEAVLADPSARFIRASDVSDGAFVEDFCNWQRIPALERFARTSPAAGIAGSLIESATVRLFHDHVLVKEPGTAIPTRWHQDQPYYNVDGHQNVSMWMPVDPVDRKASMNFVAGTHLGPWYLPRTFLEGAAKWFPEGSLAELPHFDAEADGTEGGTWRTVGWALEPGDAVFFHMATVHGAGPNEGPGRRRALSLRFLGDDMVYAHRPWKTSPDFGDLTASLVDGEPLDHPAFPLLVG